MSSHPNSLTGIFDYSLHIGRTINEQITLLKYYDRIITISGKVDISFCQKCLLLQEFLSPEMVENIVQVVHGGEKRCTNTIPYTW